MGSNEVGMLRETTVKVDDGGWMTAIWLAKVMTLLVPSSIFPRVWTTHPHIAFGLGLAVGSILQHFIPPRGKLQGLCVLLLLAALGAFVDSRWGTWRLW